MIRQKAVRNIDKFSPRNKNKFNTVYFLFYTARISGFSRVDRSRWAALLTSMGSNHIKKSKNFDKT
jgi:hypothetical protein